MSRSLSLWSALGSAALLASCSGGNTASVTPSGAGAADTGGSIDKQMSDMANNGVNVVRWWIWPDFRSDGVTFSGNNATGLSGTMTQDINKALELAAKYDLYIMLDLFSFDTF